MMRFPALLPYALVWFVSFLTDVTTAQLVEVGPGYVRAPFVRVYTGPDGSSRVQAPFVDVYTPGYRMGRRYRAPAPGLVWPRPPMPVDTSGRLGSTVDNVASMDWKQLKETLHRLSTQLEIELQRFGTKAAGWERYLHTDDLRGLDAYDDLPPSAAETQRLGRILEAFQTTNQTESFRAIAALDSFHAAHAALAELLSAPLERQARLLRYSGRYLERDLKRMAAGMQWRTYLTLPIELLATSDSDNSHSVRRPDSGLDAEAEMADLDQMLIRFETVSGDPSYRQLAELASFQATHRHLATYVALVRNVDTQGDGRDSSLEELPPPVPQ